MKHFKKSASRGFIVYIIVIIIAVILIAYFRADIQKLLNYPGVKSAIIIAIDWIQQGLLWIVDKLGWTSSQIK